MAVLRSIGKHQGSNVPLGAVSGRLDRRGPKNGSLSARPQHASTLSLGVLVHIDPLHRGLEDTELRLQFGCLMWMLFRPLSDLKIAQDLRKTIHCAVWSKA